MSGGKLKVLSLFAGIGGFDLGLERTGGFETVAFCEIDPFAQRILEKHWPGVPIYDDVRTLTAERLSQDGVSIIPVSGECGIDCIVGGFPCQDVSSSGKGEGLDGQRSGLWAEYCRLIREISPAFIIVENVSDLLHRGLGQVLGDLASSGYDAEWHSIPASFVGLPQARERVWIIAYPGRVGWQGRAQWNGDGALLKLRPNDDRLAVGQRRARDARAWVRRADDGLPNRLHRVAALGNAVVPQIPELIGRAILASLEQAEAA